MRYPNMDDVALDVLNVSNNESISTTYIFYVYQSMKYAEKVIIFTKVDS